MIKKALNLVYTVILIAVLFLAGITALSATGLPKQFQIFVVKSGSMEPAVKTGNVIIVKPENSYQKGDIITFKSEKNSEIKNPNKTITHRIVNISKTKGEVFYETKGDANKSADITKRPKSLVLGKVVFQIPLLGYAVGFAKTPTGFAILIVIPATVIAYSEILNIKNEIAFLLSKRKQRKNESRNS